MSRGDGSGRPVTGGVRGALDDARAPGGLTRLLRRTLWSAPDFRVDDVFARQGRAYVKAGMLVRIFYVVSLGWTISQLQDWTSYNKLKSLTPLWPIVWSDVVGTNTSVNLIMAAYVLAGLAVFAFPEWRVLRIAYTFTLFQYMGLANSFGKVNHGMHAWLFVSFVFIFLPDRRWRYRRDISTRQQFLTVFWAAQLIVLMFYSLTGMWKVLYGVADLVRGHTGAFSFDGFSLLVADRLLQTNSDAVLGKFFVEHAFIGWILYLGTMYFETFSILIAFRPRLQPTWAFVLVLFHIGVMLAMDILFMENVVLVGLLLLYSPFAPGRVQIRKAVEDLPIVHFVVRRRARQRSRAPVARAPVTSP